MRFRLAIAMGAVLSLGLIGPAHADSADEKAIRALFAKLEQAFKNKDMKAIMAMSTSDFTEKMPNGTVLTAKQAEAQMTQEFAMIKSIKEVSMKPGKIKVNGKTATAMSDFKFNETVVDQMGQLGKKGATHAMSGTGQSRVTLAKGQDGWKFKREEALKVNMTLDGKPFNPMAPPPKKPGN